MTRASVRRWGLAVAASVVLVTCAHDLRAHDLRPGVVTLRQVGLNTFAVSIEAPLDGTQSPLPVDVQWPRGCRLTQDQLRCKGPLTGTITIPALSGRRVKTLLYVRWAPTEAHPKGRTWQRLLLEGQSSATIPPLTMKAVDSGWLRWVFAGFQHIFEGLDHLLFILGFAMLTRSLQSLLFAVTGFTAGHSVTLLCAALGVSPLRSQTVELLIAASVLLVAAEVLRERPTLSRRRPGWVATGFGLLHGLGFAGAIGELGLSGDDVLASLLSFNLGIELGQLCWLAALLGVVSVARRLGVAFEGLRPLALPVRRVAAYALGLPAGVWAVERFAGWWA